MFPIKGAFPMPITRLVLGSVLQFLLDSRGISTEIAAIKLIMEIGRFSDLIL